MREVLLEVKRSDLLSRSKSSDNYVPSNQHKGKNRYYRRTHSKLASSVKNFNSIDMNKFFKTDILDVDIDVTGETDLYTVRISFAGTVDQMYREISKGRILDRRLITQCLLRAFNADDVYINCTCPDFKYRGKYWATRNEILIGAPENRPSDITNPNDTKGPGCKHITLALSDSSWLIRVSSVIYNYINYLKELDSRLYQEYIYPAIYKEPYPNDETQLDISNIDDSQLGNLDIRFSEYQELVDSDIEKFGDVTDDTLDLIADAGLYIDYDGDTPIVVGNKLDVSNKAAVERGRFKKNPKSDSDEEEEEEVKVKSNKNQISLDDFDEN